jgi:hypothetical protein
MRGREETSVRRSSSGTSMDFFGPWPQKSLRDFSSHLPTCQGLVQLWSASHPQGEADTQAWRDGDDTSRGVLLGDKETRKKDMVTILLLGAELPFPTKLG